jgi:Mrp family chromosome partitioning ATPase
VGKSTVAVNTAFALAMNGMKVGILDVDIHGPSIAKMLGIEGKTLKSATEGGRPQPIRVVENIYALTIASLMENPDEPVIWRGPLKISVIRQFMKDIEWPELDYLIVDCPPGTGDEPLSVIQTLKDVDGTIIVSTPQDVALLDARKTITFSGKMNVPVIGIVENMAMFHCPHCGEPIDIFKGTGVKKAAADFGVDILGSIPIDANIVETGDAGRPFVYDFGKTAAAQAMQSIVMKIIEKVEKK